MLEFKLPDVAEGIHEAEILRWMVAPGEQVKLDQPMVEIQTDKSVAEIGGASLWQSAGDSSAARHDCPRRLGAGNAGAARRGRKSYAPHIGE